MAINMGKWPSKRGPISKIRPSDGCGRNAVPLAVERYYDFHGFRCHLGNVGQTRYGKLERGYFSQARRMMQTCVQETGCGRLIRILRIAIWRERE